MRPETQPGTELELQEDPGALAELATVFATIQDPKVPWEDRAAIYQTLHALQLEVNRVLRKVKPLIVYAMDHASVTRAGRIRLKWKARDVKWRCNEPPAWEDAQVQTALEALAADPVGKLFTRAVPRHLELDTAFLGVAMANPSMIPVAAIPVGVAGPERLQEYARGLWKEANRAGWRVEVNPEPTLELDEAKR